MIRHSARYPGRCSQCSRSTWRGELLGWDKRRVYCSDCANARDDTERRQAIMRRDAFAAGKRIGDAQD